MNLVNQQDLREFVGNILNVDLPKHIPELQSCMATPDFKKWFDEKFCKYTQKIENSDLPVLVESINDCLLGLHGVDVIAERIDTLEAKLIESKKAFALRSCPFNVGDVGTIVRLRHVGKRGIITEINYKRGFKSRHSWVAKVDLYKRDGSLSELSTDFDSEDCFELEVKQEA